MRHDRIIRGPRDAPVVVQEGVRDLAKARSASALSHNTGSPLTLPEVATSGEPKSSSNR